jgi:hypothetical protein
MRTTTALLVTTAAAAALLLEPAAAFRPSSSSAAGAGAASQRAFGSRIQARGRMPLCMSAVGDKPKADAAAPGPSIGWDSHQAVSEAPESLVRGIEGNESMRRRFEQACRAAQVGWGWVVGGGWFWMEGGGFWG